MTSERQYSANRANALMSTGPKTPEGKARSSKNALKHGLTADSVVLEGEDKEAFEQLHAMLKNYYEVQSIVAQELCKQAAQYMWRMRRAAGFEAALMAWVHERQKAEETNSWMDAPGRLLNSRVEDDSDIDPDHDNRVRVGRLVEDLLKGDVLGKLQRYDAHNLRQLKTVLAELERMCLARREEKEGLKAEAESA
jgi:hypothetical protein